MHGVTRELEVSEFVPVWFIPTVLLYWSETWRGGSPPNTGPSPTDRRDWWPRKILNKELWQSIKQEKIEITILTRKWRWISHNLRKRARPCHPVAKCWVLQIELKRTSRRNIVAWTWTNEYNIMKNLTIFKLKPTTWHRTCRNWVAKRAQYVVPRAQKCCHMLRWNVAIVFQGLNTMNLLT